MQPESRLGGHPSPALFFPEIASTTPPTIWQFSVLQIDIKLD